MTQVPQAVIWLVSAVLVEAAVIDGRQLRVPNWLTFHFALGALVIASSPRHRNGLAVATVQLVPCPSSRSWPGVLCRSRSPSRAVRYGWAWRVRRRRSARLVFTEA